MYVQKNVSSSLRVLKLNFSPEMAINRPRNIFQGQYIFIADLFGAFSRVHRIVKFSLNNFKTFSVILNLAKNLFLLKNNK